MGNKAPLKEMREIIFCWPNKKSYLCQLLSQILSAMPNIKRVFDVRVIFLWNIKINTINHLKVLLGK